jgi:hypothetical protein
MAITLRTTKGSELSFAELDGNFTHLRDNPDGIVLPKTAGVGIKVDPSAPTFGWRDLLAEIHPKASGAGSPYLAVFRGAVKSYFFIANDESDSFFHVPHDYVPGSDMYLHLHWSHNGTNISGSLVVSYSVTYAKGHGQGVFNAPVNPIQTLSGLNITNTPQYGHRIDEFQLTSSTPSATQINSALIEPDGVFIINMKATTVPTITGGTETKPTLIYMDLHYQSTGIPTKNKSPNFWA